MWLKGFDESKKCGRYLREEKELTQRHGEARRPRRKEERVINHRWIQINTDGFIFKISLRFEDCENLNLKNFIILAS